MSSVFSESDHQASGSDRFIEINPSIEDPLDREGSYSGQAVEPYSQAETIMPGIICRDDLQLKCHFTGLIQGDPVFLEHIRLFRCLCEYLIASVDPDSEIRLADLNIKVRFIAGWLFYINYLSIRYNMRFLRNSCNLSPRYCIRRLS